MAIREQQISSPPSSLASRINIISAKLFGLGELIRFQGGEPALNQERAHFGIGEILTDLANQLSEIEESLTASGSSDKERDHEM